MKKSTSVSFAGIMAGLSFTLLYFGSVMWLFAYAAPMVCGLIMMMLNKTFGKKYALCVFLSVSILSILFLPDKDAGLVYLFFFGYYPLIKEKLEKIKPKAICVLLKFIIFNAGILTSQLVLIYVFGIPLENDFGKWAIPLFIVLFNLFFITYEKLYTVLLYLYSTKIEKRIKNMLNK